MLEPVGTAPGLVVPPARRRPDGRRAARAAARAAADVGGRRGDRGLPRGRRARARRVRQGDAAAVRDPRVRDRRDAARGRGRRTTSTAWRSPPACAAARSRSSPATSPRPRAPTTRFVESVRERHADTLFSDDGSTVDEQVAPAARARLHDRDGRVVHRRAARRAADRAAGLLGLRARRGGRLLQRGQGGAGRRGPALIERVGAVSTEVAEALADGARARAGRRRRRRDHRHRRAGRRDRGQAGRARLLLGRRAGRRAAHAQRPPAGRPRRRARPLDDGRDAPACAGCCWARRRAGAR